MSDVRTFGYVDGVAMLYVDGKCIGPVDDHPAEEVPNSIVNKLTPEEVLLRMKKLLNPNNDITVGRLQEIMKGSLVTAREEEQLAQLVLLDQEWAEKLKDRRTDAGMSILKMPVGDPGVYDGDVSAELKLDKHMAAALAEYGIDPGKHSVINPIDLGGANYQQFGRLKRSLKDTRSRKKREGTYDHWRFGIQKWRKRGRKSRQRSKRQAIRNRLRGEKLAKDHAIKSQSYNLMTSQESTFGEAFFPTVTVFPDKLPAQLKEAVDHAVNTKSLVARAKAITVAEINAVNIAELRAMNAAMATILKQDPKSYAIYVKKLLDSNAMQKES